MANREIALGIELNNTSTADRISNLIVSIKQKSNIDEIDYKYRELTKALVTKMSSMDDDDVITNRILASLRNSALELVVLNSFDLDQLYGIDTAWFDALFEMVFYNQNYSLLFYMRSNYNVIVSKFVERGFIIELNAGSLKLIVRYLSEFKINFLRACSSNSSRELLELQMGLFATFGVTQELLGSLQTMTASVYSMDVTDYYDLFNYNRPMRSVDSVVDALVRRVSALDGSNLNINYVAINRELILKTNAYFNDDFDAPEESSIADAKEMVVLCDLVKRDLATSDAFIKVEIALNDLMANTKDLEVFDLVEGNLRYIANRIFDIYDMSNNEKRLLRLVISYLVSFWKSFQNLCSVPEEKISLARIVRDVQEMVGTSDNLLAFCSFYTVALHYVS